MKTSFSGFSRHDIVLKVFGRLKTSLVVECLIARCARFHRETFFNLSFLLIRYALGKGLLWKKRKDFQNKRNKAFGFLTNIKNVIKLSANT